MNRYVRRMASGWRIGLALWVALAGFGAGRALGAEKSRTEEWYVVEEQGQRRSKGVVVRQLLKASDGNEPALVSVNETRETRQEREGLLYESRIDTRTVTAEDGTARSRETTTLSGNHRRVETVVIDRERREARLNDNQPGGPGKRKIPVPDPVRFGIDAEHIPVMAATSGQALAPGLRLDSSVLDASTGSVAVETVVVKAVASWRDLRPAIAPEPAAELLPPGAVVVDAESRTEGRNPVRMVFTPGGRLLWMGRPDGLVAWRAVTRAEYEQAGAALAIVTRLPHGGYLPAWESYDQLVFALTPAEAWRGLVPERNEYATLAAGPDGGPVVVMTAPAAGGAEGIPPAAGEWLASTAAYPTRHPAIVKAAREADQFQAVPDAVALPGEAADLARLRRLAGWVRRRITSTNQGQLILGPVEALAARQGHCGEHARLLITFCRYWDIPARLCQGLTVRTGELVYHAWVEAWVGGRWTPVDSTAGLTGFRAGYWLTARETPDGQLVDPLPRAMQGGGLGVRWLAAAVLDPDGDWMVWRQDHPSPPLVRKGEGAFDLGWGVGLWRPPSGWRFLPGRDSRGGEVDETVGLMSSSPTSGTPAVAAGTATRVPVTLMFRGAEWRNGVSLAWASGRGTEYSVQAWPGTFNVDGFALQQRLGTLGKELKRFRRDKARLDEWPGSGGGAALMVDFRWRSGNGLDRWARQWDVPLAERKARASFHGGQSADYEASDGRELFRDSRIR